MTTSSVPFKLAGGKPLDPSEFQFLHFIYLILINIAS